MSRRKPFRPYRIIRKPLETKPNEIWPHHDCHYLIGDVISCKDGTERSVVDIKPRHGMWIICWILVNERGEGASLESYIKSIDRNFKNKKFKFTINGQ